MNQIKSRDSWKRNFREYKLVSIDMEIVQINIQQIANIIMFSNHSRDVITWANRIVHHQTQGKSCFIYYSL